MKLNWQKLSVREGVILFAMGVCACLCLNMAIAFFELIRIFPGASEAPTGQVAADGGCDAGGGGAGFSGTGVSGSQKAQQLLGLCPAFCRLLWALPRQYASGGVRLFCGPSSGLAPGAERPDFCAYLGSCGGKLNVYRGQVSGGFRLCRGEGNTGVWGGVFWSRSLAFGSLVPEVSGEERIIKLGGIKYEIVVDSDPVL